MPEISEITLLLATLDKTLDKSYILRKTVTAISTSKYNENSPSALYTLSNTP